ncbi:MAG: NTP transferase domain-containing protein [Bacteroidetes bacterium]|nr:NTP transferase domain-containing protein [Bacteroidota bacterium]
MKAIIPVAGAGTRLRPLTYTQPKALIPIAGKTILGFIIDQLKDAGFNEFVFIIGYLGEKIEDYVSKKYPDIKAHFIKQDTREGIGHAIWSAKEVIEKDEEIFIVLGDTIFEAELKEVLKSKYSSLGVKKVDDPRFFGVAEINKDGFIKRVDEKPKMPKSNLALVGVYYIKESGQLMEALDYNIKKDVKTINEFQLTDAIQRMLEKGTKFTSFKIGNWYDCGKKEVLLETNATLLKKMEYASQDIPMFENTIIVHPVSIAEGVKISNSIIGPNVTLGENATIKYGLIKESIIGSYARIEDASLHHSVIGSDAYIKGISQSLNIGDNTEIDFS